MQRRVVIALVLSIFAATVVTAQQHPAKEKGFNAERLYDFRGIDTINTFNFNLIVTIPLGQRYTVNNNLSYGLTLVYNGEPWDEWGDLDPANPFPQYLEATSSRRSNAGNGWTVSLGRLIAPGDPHVQNSANLWAHSGLNTFDDGTPTFSAWIYESPDGHDHVFQCNPDSGPCLPYKEDSMIRLMKDPDPNFPDYRVEFPDGMYQTFRNYEAAGKEPIYRLHSTQDRFGNGYYINYTWLENGTATTSKGKTYNEKWEINEYDNGDAPTNTSVPRRTQTLYFLKYDGRPDVTTDPRPTTYTQTLLQEVDETGFGTSNTSYIEFDYGAGPELLARPSWDRSLRNHDTYGSPAHGDPMTVFLLRNVKFDATNESYKFDYFYGTTSDLPDSQGSLRKITLPTGGSISYTYQSTSFLSLRIGGIETNPDIPPDYYDPSYRPWGPSYRDTNIGIGTRTLTDEKGNTGTWNYDRSFTPDVTYSYTDTSTNTTVKEIFRTTLVSTVREPETTAADPITGQSVHVSGGTSTTYYYSVYNDHLGHGATANTPERWTYKDPNGNNIDRNWEFQFEEFGAPITRYYPDITGKDLGRLFLSTETRRNATATSAGELVRTTYSRQERFSSAPAQNQETARRVTYNLDQSCRDPLAPANAAACYSESFNSSFQNGHFQQVSSFSNFTRDGDFIPSNSRTTFTKYNVPAANGNWVLETFSEQCAEDVFHAAPVTSCAGMHDPNVSIQRYCFDTSTGFLKMHRVQKGAIPDDHDVLTQFVSEKLPSDRETGNVAHEFYYGAHAGGAGTAEETCSTSSTPTYTIDNTYQYGVLAKSKYNLATFYSLDQDIDKATGLVATSRDTSELATTYLYDAAGRLTNVTAPGLAPIQYAYHPFDGTNLANVVATQNASTYLVPDPAPNAPGYGQTQSTYVYDGFGRLIEERSLTPSDGTAAHRIEYDPLWNKISVSAVETYSAGWAPQHKAYSFYDSFNRVNRNVSLDKKTSTAVYDGEGVHHLTRTTGINTTGAVDGGVSQDTNVPVDEYYDTNGKLVRVDEPSGPNGESVKTLYGYDIGDRLTSVAMHGTETTQTRAFAYDNRGFLLWEQHPELGRNGNGKAVYGPTESDAWYDARGHALRKVEGSVNGPFDLQFGYDFAERLVSVDHVTGGTPENVKTFVYAPDGVADHKRGKLDQAIRHNRISSGDVRVTETYSYTEPGGRVTTRSTAIDKIDTANNVTPIQTFKQDHIAYTPFGQIESADQPTCELHPCSAGYQTIGRISNYVHNGQVVRVTEKSGSAFKDWAELTYEPNGFLRTITHVTATGNKAQVDEQVPDDSGIPRPKEITFKGYCVGPSINAAEPVDRVQQQQSTLATIAITPPVGAANYEWYQVTAGVPSSTPVTWGPAASSYTVPFLTQPAQFFVRVYDAAGCSSDSRIATVSLCDAVVVNTAPHDTPVGSDGRATFTIAVTPSDAKIEWFAGDTPSPDKLVGTGASFTTPVLTQTAKYVARVTLGDCVLVEPTVNAIVCTPVSIAQDLDDQTVSGTSADITSQVIVSGGTPPYAYTWTVSDTDGTNVHITPITTNSPTSSITTTLSAAGAKLVSVKVTSCNSQVTSRTATIRVSAPNSCAPKLLGYSPVSAILAPGEAIYASVAMDPPDTTTSATDSNQQYRYDWYRGKSPTPIGGNINWKQVPLSTSSWDSFYVVVTKLDCPSYPVTSPRMYIRKYGSCPITPVTISPNIMTVPSGTTTIIYAYTDWPKVDFQWYRGEAGNTRFPVDHVSSHPDQLLVNDIPATYWVRVSNDCGQSYDSNIVYVNRGGAGACSPVVIHGTMPDLAVSAGDQVTLSVDANSNDSLSKIQWYQVNPNQPQADLAIDGTPFFATTSAVYYATVTNSCGATATTRYISVRVNSCSGTQFSPAPPASILADDQHPVVINATTTNPTLVSSIKWYEGVPGDPRSTDSGISGATFSKQYGASTTVWARGTTSSGCAFDSPGTYVDVCVHPQAVETTDQYTNIVLGQFVWIGFKFTGSDLQYQWFTGPAGDEVHSTPTGDTLQLIQVHPFQTTQYWVKATNRCGTAVSKGYFVSICPSITDIHASATTIMPGSTVQLSVTGDGQYLKYVWYKGHAGDYSSPLTAAGGTAATGAFTYTTPPLTTDTTYWAAVTSGSCTSASDEITIHVCGPINIVISQANTAVHKTESQIIGLSASLVDQAIYWYQGQSGDVTHSTLINTTTTSNGISIAPSATTSYWARMYDTTRICYGDTPTLTVQVCIPRITAQPQSTMINSGDTAHLTVVADLPDVTYQWYAGTTAIPGATSATLDVSPTTDTTYKVRVTGSCTAFVDSSDATVSICKPANITNPPTSFNYDPNYHHTLAVIATGTNIHYQWYRGVKGDTTSPVCSDASTCEVDGSATTNYWLRVTAQCGPAADSNTVTVSVCPTIVSQPVAAKPVMPGGTTTISLTAAGSLLEYLWYQGAQFDVSHPITGVNAPTMTTPPLTQATKFWAYVKSGNCLVPSNEVTVNMCAVTATWATYNASVAANQNQTISISAPAGVNVVFYRGTAGDVAGSTVQQASSQATGCPISPATTTSYWARVTDPSTGCYADTSTLTISVCIPTITTQPQSQTIVSGSSAHLTVATNLTGVTYQWFSGSTAISGATNSYVDVTPTSDTTYKVRVTGTCNVSVDSSVATVTVCNPPAITTNPVPNVNIQPNASYDLSVTATGSNLSYQWYQGVSGTTTTPVGTNSRTYHATPSGTTSYWVKVSGTCGNPVNSTTATVSVCPAITQQPAAASNNLHPGSSTTITVAASGSPLTYQWYIGNSGDISHPVGTNSNSLNTGALSATTTYWVNITSGTCPVASQAVTVSVCSLSPYWTTGISTQVRSGYTQTLTVSVPAGTTSAIYRGTPGDVAGSTIITYSGSTTVAPTSTTTYWARLTDTTSGCYGDVSVTITVCVPTITTQPSSATVSPGGSATLSVVANGGTLTYQWYNGGTAINGATGSSYTASPSASPYFVRVTGTCSQYVDSSSVTVTACSNPAITTQPTSPAAVGYGYTSALSVVASGTGLTYQWYSGVTGDTTHALSGKTTSTLSMAVYATEQYWVRVSGQCGTPVNSNNAFLSTYPTIYSGPASVQLTPGSTAYFTVNATGGYLHYQWYQGSTQISNTDRPWYATGPLYSNTSFSCYVTSGTALTNAGTADVTMCDGPAITTPTVQQIPGTSCKLISISWSDHGQSMYVQWFKGQRGDTSVPVTAYGGAGSTVVQYQACTAGTNTYWARFTDGDVNCYTDSAAVTVTN